VLENRAHNNEVDISSSVKNPFVYKHPWTVDIFVLVFVFCLFLFYTA